MLIKTDSSKVKGKHILLNELILVILFFKSYMFDVHLTNKGAEKIEDMDCKLENEIIEASNFWK